MMILNQGVKRRQNAQIRKKILEQRDERNTNYQHYKYKGIKNHKNIQVRQHKPRKRGVKPVPPKESEHMKVIQHFFYIHEYNINHGCSNILAYLLFVMNFHNIYIEPRTKHDDICCLFSKAENLTIMVVNIRSTTKVIFLNCPFYLTSEWILFHVHLFAAFLM